MQIILIPDKDGKASHHICLTARVLVGLAIVFWLILPVTVGAGIHQMSARLSSLRVTEPQVRYQIPSIDPASITYLEDSIRTQMRDIDDVRQTSKSHFDTLGLKLGALQAQMMRIDALGARLTTIAGLQGDDFNFGEPPPLGGPAALEDVSEPHDTAFFRSLEDLSLQAKVSYAQLGVLQTLLMKRDLQREIEPVGWPTKGGWVSSSYGYRRDPFTGQKTFHRGVDIANHPNAEIKAIAAGIATVIRDDPGYGLLLEVNHGGGYATRYAHLMESKVHVGERVEKGQVIGVVGSTGRSTGAHLHFEVLKEGKAVNPREYLKTTS